MFLGPHEHSLGRPLRCAGCGDTWTHQFAVKYFFRGEDQDKGLAVDCEEFQVVVDRLMEGNPSPRRQGIYVLFSCELCPSLTKMTIVQHKGQTFIDVSEIPPVRNVAPIKAPAA